MNYIEMQKYLLEGKRIRRENDFWKNKYLYLVEGSQFIVNRKPLSDFLPEGSVINYRAHIDLIEKNEDGTYNVCVWFPINEEIYANDYCLVSEE